MTQILTHPRWQSTLERGRKCHPTSADDPLRRCAGPGDRGAGSARGDLTEPGSGAFVAQGGTPRRAASGPGYGWGFPRLVHRLLDPGTRQGARAGTRRFRDGRRGPVAVRILLDTNAYSRLAQGHLLLSGRVRQAETVLLSSVVAGEALRGFL